MKRAAIFLCLLCSDAFQPPLRLPLKRSVSSRLHVVGGKDVVERVKQSLAEGSLSGIREGDEAFDECLVEFSPNALCAPPAEEPPATPDLAYLQSLGVLLLITLMWALNTPAVRYMYLTVDHTPPLVVFNAAASLAALFTVAITGALTPKSSKRKSKAALPLFDDEQARSGGLELGTYKFLAAGFNYLGISLTLSTQAAFFVQLTTMFVPVAQALGGVKLPPRIWAATAMALGGVAMLAVDGASSAEGKALQDLLLGDAFCAVAACFYACYDLRVNDWGRRAATLNLTTWKTAFQSIYAVAALGIVAAAGPTFGPSSAFWSFFKEVQPQEAGLILGTAAFSGAMANGLATLLQIPAQERVGPSRAQLLYSTNPLWNALIAVVFLHESIGTWGYAGGCLFIGALTIAATTPPEPAKSDAPPPEVDSPTARL